jgi:hypothetical protein
MVHRRELEMSLCATFLAAISGHSFPRDISSLCKMWNELSGQVPDMLILSLDKTNNLSHRRPLFWVCPDTKICCSG